MRCSEVIGRCGLFFCLGILADITGIILLFLGIFANLSYWDFFIYTGAIVLGLSIVFWIFWYTFNEEVSYEELGLVITYDD